MLGLFILIWIHLCPCMSFLDLRPWKRPHTVPRRETSLARQHRFVNRNCEIAEFRLPELSIRPGVLQVFGLGPSVFGPRNSKTQDRRPKTQDLVKLDWKTTTHFGHTKFRNSAFPKSPN